MSDDIPVGSPPAPPGRHAAPSGWYPDPVDSRTERYWDGWQWSRNTRPFNGPVRQPSQPAGYPAPVPGGAWPRNQPTQTPSGQANFTEDRVPLARWGWRLLAVVVDTVLVGIVVTLLSIPIYLRMLGPFRDYISKILEAARTGQPPPAAPSTTELLSATDQLLAALIAIAVGMVYHVLFLRLRQATPGKLVCGLLVVPADQGQVRGGLPWRMAIVRAAVWVIPGQSAIFYLLRLVDGLFPLWHRKRQALHDVAAGTQVVKLR